MNASTGKAYLVGAGPGDLGLVTLRAKELVEKADLLLYDYLSNPEILHWTRPDCEKIYVGKKAGNHTLSQEKINELLVSSVQKNKIVVRLKGGDPFVFGRGGEEAEALAENGCEFEIVPGISSAIAAPAYAGIPVTHRDFTSTFTIITGHEDSSKKNSSLYWKQLAEDKGTKVFLMGLENIAFITEQLVNFGAEASTPVAVIRWGTLGRQQTVEGTLETIEEIVEVNQIKPPAVMIIGRVVSLRETLNWFEKKPLFGKRIVVTRTRDQASVLTKRLRELGAAVMEIPTIKIIPQPLSNEAKTMLQKPTECFDWLVFTSPNAVDLFFKEFFKINSDLRALGSIHLASVGAATTQKLTDLHLSIVKQPDEFTTEALAKVFEPHEIKDKRFCFPHGNLADPHLAAHLREHGGTVTEWILYQTVLEKEDETGARAEYENEGADWITFTSSSTVENWHALNLKTKKSSTAKTKHISIGPITTAALKKLGYSIDAEAKVYTVDGLIDSLLRVDSKKETAIVHS